MDYPYELVNNLTTNDATKGLSAAQGKVLDGKISQLDQDINGVSVHQATNNDILSGLYLNSIGTWTSGASSSVLVDISNLHGLTIKVSNYTNGYYALLTNNTHTEGGTASYVTGTGRTAYTGQDITVPDTANYFYLSLDTHLTLPNIAIVGTYPQGLKVTKQDVLVSGENIKTINGQSVVGAGNVEIPVPLIDDKSSNLLDITKAVSGFIITTTGEISESSSYTTSDYIPVNAGDKIAFSYKTSNISPLSINAKYIACFDADKQILSSKGSSTSSTFFVVPEDVKFLRFSWNSSTYGTSKQKLLLIITLRYMRIILRKKSSTRRRFCSNRITVLSPDIYMLPSGARLRYTIHRSASKARIITYNGYVPSGRLCLANIPLLQPAQC